jgi:hypothetical protein
LLIGFFLFSVKAIINKDKVANILEYPVALGGGYPNNSLSG